MAFRFRRSLKLAPGLRLNVGKRGFSLSAGVRGASVTLGKHGVYGNVGLPGTGLSYRTKLDRSGQGVQRAPGRMPTGGAMDVQILLDDDGTVSLLGPDGALLPPRLVRVVREQQGDFIASWLQEQCDRWNLGIEELLALHLQTPAGAREHPPEPFSSPAPTRPAPRPVGFLGRLFRARREAIERENAAAEDRYRQAFAEWEAEKAANERKQAERRDLLDRARCNDRDAMAVVLEETLALIDWPRETSVSFDVDDGGRTVYLDVDLPEIEDMPAEQAEVAARGLKLNIKKRSDTQRRREYMTHIHAVAFRVIGETLAALPAAERVVFSGYSQRPDRATGHIADEYLLSVIVPRSGWSEINFGNLEGLDLVAAFERFELRRRMTRTGVFTPVEPFGRGA